MAAPDLNNPYVALGLLLTVLNIGKTLADAFGGWWQAKRNGEMVPKLEAAIETLNTTISTTLHQFELKQQAVLAEMRISQVQMASEVKSLAGEVERIRKHYEAQQEHVNQLRDTVTRMKGAQ